jgi:hypothetical protein
MPNLPGYLAVKGTTPVRAAPYRVAADWLSVLSETTVRANAPDGAEWEFYAVLADLDTYTGQPAA